MIRLRKILKVLIPSVFSAEAGYLALVAALMAARTYADVWMIRNGTAVERSIITRDKKAFIKHVREKKT